MTQQPGGHSQPCTAVAKAESFVRDFEPKENVDYAWVEEIARKEHERLLAAFNDLDTKATAIINYMTSGTGLFTLGTLAALYSAKVPAEIVGCAIPSIACAIVAVIFAVIARRPLSVFPPPDSSELVKLAEHYSGKEDVRGKALMIPQWQLAIARMRDPIETKAWNIERATWFTITAVAFLLLPLFVALVSGE